MDSIHCRRTSAPHFFSIDVEEYFHVSAFEGLVRRDRWHTYPSRLASQLDVLIDLLARHEATATCFTLGWIARHHPRLVRRLADAGHEIASHGTWHERLTTMTPRRFRNDVRTARTALEDACGRRVYGYRAPSFSLVRGGEWAFDVLLEEGHTYDSSLFPIRRPGYGYPGTPALPHDIRRESGVLREYPLATLSVAGVGIPAAGGGYLRHLPFAVTQTAFRRATAVGHSAMFYIHPWELDTSQPRMPVGWLAQRRHYHGLERTWGRIDALLSEFRFASIASVAGATGTAFSVATAAT
jgi:polysaccharide deacetylase family protein (PEP-CTERM system associated)